MTKTQEEISPSDGIMAFNSEVKYSPFIPGGRICGSCASGWESVKDAFAKNFADGLEQGAQLCIMQENDVVVDLYGIGSQESKANINSYCHDTLQPIFSSGKNLEVMVIAALVDKGLVSYSDPISKHWPEFGQKGKQRFTIADLMRHSAGLAYFTNPDDEKLFRFLSYDDIIEREPMHKLIETSPPQKFGKSQKTYHAFTRGFVVDGIVKHIDPAGRTIGQFARDEILIPLGISDQYLVSFNPEEDLSRFSVATLSQYPVMFSICHELGPAMLGVGDPALSRVVSLFSPTSIFSSTGMGVDFEDIGWKDPSGTFNPLGVNNEKTRRLEGTSFGNYASARSMTRLLSVLSNNGSIDGIRLFSPDTVKAILSEVIVDTDDFLCMISGYTQGGLGALSTVKDSDGIYANKDFYKGLYGWGGLGGSINAFHPEKKVTISYAVNTMGNYIFGDPRFDRILGEVAKILES